MASLRLQLQSLSRDQIDISAENTRHRDDILGHAASSESSVTQTMKALRDLVASNDLEAANRQEEASHRLSHDISSVQTNVGVILAQQNDIMSSQRLLVAKVDAEVHDAHILARLIRVELRQQLEPLLDRIDGATEHVDKVAMAFTVKMSQAGIPVFQAFSPPPRRALGLLGAIPCPQNGPHPVMGARTLPDAARIISNTFWHHPMRYIYLLASTTLQPGSEH